MLAIRQNSDLLPVEVVKPVSTLLLIVRDLFYWETPLEQKRQQQSERGTTRRHWYSRREIGRGDVEVNRHCITLIISEMLKKEVCILAVANVFQKSLLFYLFQFYYCL